MDNNKKTSDSTELKWCGFPLELAKKEWSNPSVVLVYSFMLNRYNFFLRNKKATQKEIYFESQKNIAEHLGLGERTVTTCIALLKEHGYLSYNLIRQGNSFKNSYTIVDVHKLVNDSDKPNKTKVKPISVIKPKLKEPSKFSWMEDDEDDRF